MNSIKPICLSAFAILVLAGCETQKQVSSLVEASPISIKKNI
jgi:uncharacterized lipoprotein YajG